MAAIRRKKAGCLSVFHALMTISILAVTILILILYVQIKELDKAMEEVDIRLKSLQQQIDVLEEERLAQQGDYGQPLQEPDNSQMIPDSGGNIAPDMEQPEGQETAQADTSSKEEAGQQAGHKVYLTFDDGPGKYTEEILDILDRYDVKATFFVVGQEAEKKPELVQEIVNRGHTLGMHSYSHDYEEIYQSEEAFEADLSKVQDCLYEITDEISLVYRFPGGSSNMISTIDMHVFADCLAARGIRFFDWNISSGDGSSTVQEAATIVENCTVDKGITRRETSIILMHDAAQKHTTVEALPGIIENILKMEDTAILPITENTQEVHHID